MIVLISRNGELDRFIPDNSVFPYASGGRLVSHVDAWTHDDP